MQNVPWDDAFQHNAALVGHTLIKLTMETLSGYPQVSHCKAGAVRDNPSPRTGLFHKLYQLGNVMFAPKGIRAR